MTHPFMWDRLWTGGHLATLDPGSPGYGEIRDGALAVRGERIVWMGAARDLPSSPESCAREVHDLKEGWLTPGLVDCHTHLVFAGDRSGEYEERLHGSSYEEIARQGGGIRTTMRATRKASAETLFQEASRRVETLSREGVTTVEVKSGYGLETMTELRMLAVARRLGGDPAVDVQTTLLAAHALPPEFQGRRSEYLELIRREILPEAVSQGLADAVDAFCDEIAFTPDECEEVLRAGQEAGLGVRIHADQLSDQGGAALAARLGARSADHLEHAAPEGVARMAEAGTVAVLLPGAFFYLREERVPPVSMFRDAGVPMALATDLNPGSSPVNSLLATLTLGCVLFRLTPEEALRGVTAHGARALGMADDRGTLEPGKRADLAVWDVDHPRELCYWLGQNPCRGVVKDGIPVLR